MTSHFLNYVLSQVSEIRYRRLNTAYSNFVQNADKIDSRAVKVFAPMSNDVLQELELVREVTKELQRRKVEDMKKRADSCDSEEEKEEQEKKSNKSN